MRVRLQAGGRAENIDGGGCNKKHARARLAEAAAGEAEVAEEREGEEGAAGEGAAGERAGGEVEGGEGREAAEEGEGGGGEGGVGGLWGAGGVSGQGALRWGPGSLNGRAHQLEGAEWRGRPLGGERPRGEAALLRLQAPQAGARGLQQRGAAATRPAAQGVPAEIQFLHPWVEPVPNGQ